MYRMNDERSKNICLSGCVIKYLYNGIEATLSPSLEPREPTVERAMNEVAGGSRKNEKGNHRPYYLPTTDTDCSTYGTVLSENHTLKIPRVRRVNVRVSNAS
jgi:hypothetical protein